MGYLETRYVIYVPANSIGWKELTSHFTLDSALTKAKVYAKYIILKHITNFEEAAKKE